MNTWYQIWGKTYQCQISNAGDLSVWDFLSSMTFPWLLMIFQSSMTFHDFSRKFYFSRFSRFSRPCGNPEWTHFTTIWKREWIYTAIVYVQDVIWNMHFSIQSEIWQSNRGIPVAIVTLCKMHNYSWFVLLQCTAFQWWGHGDRGLLLAEKGIP